MDISKLKLVSRAGGVVIGVKVVPNSSREAVVGLLGDLLKIRVAKPPEGGAANKAVEALLARTLSVPPARVSVIAGHSQPHKQVLVMGMEVGEVKAALEGV